MNDPLIITTKLGDFAVLIHDSHRATVRAAGPKETIQVGKFNYRVFLHFTSAMGTVWALSHERNNGNTVYHNEGKKYSTEATPGIKAKVEEAAFEALLQAVRDYPLATLIGDQDQAWKELVEARSEYERIQTELELAQIRCNLAEKQWYASGDKLAEATAEIAEQVGVWVDQSEKSS